MKSLRSNTPLSPISRKRPPVASRAFSFLGVPEKTLSRWYYDYVGRQLAKPQGEKALPIKSLGIDELSLKKSTVSS